MPRSQLLNHAFKARPTVPIRYNRDRGSVFSSIGKNSCARLPRFPGGVGASTCGSLCLTREL